LKPDWGKGFSRKGAALHGQGDLGKCILGYVDSMYGVLICVVGAMDAYEQALQVEPTNAQAKAGLKAVNEAVRREAQADGAQPDLGLGSIFSDPSLITKLASNPKTSALLSDAGFMAKLARVQQNPSAIQEELRDPRMMQVIAVLLGIQMPDQEGGAGEDTEMPDAGPARPATPPPAKEPTPDQEDEKTKANKLAKEEADKEKVLGTQYYKKRQFDAAIEHYSKAWDLFKDITYLNNIAAASFEAGNYERCIKECERAIEEGREMHADFKLIAK
jgi:stress-induced-phosphoprotein 1